MRNLLSFCLILLLSFGLAISDAQAKRFGGGKSFGMQRNTSNFSRTSNSTPKATQAPASTASKWLGPLAGLALGGLLASLFMGHGIGTGILSWLLIGGAAFLIWQFFRRRFQPVNNKPMQYAAFTDANAQHNTYSQYHTNTTTNYPAGFNETDFLRNAKSQFIRLQAAFDSKNLQDLREFTAPEVFAEIQLQIQERGNAENITEVVSLDAELLNAAVDSQDTIATVRFTGSIKEEVHAPAELLSEIWHFRKDDVTSIWKVAGIQQA